MIETSANLRSSMSGFETTCSRASASTSVRRSAVSFLTSPVSTRPSSRCEDRRPIALDDLARRLEDRLDQVLPGELAADVREVRADLAARPRDAVATAAAEPLRILEDRPAPGRIAPVGEGVSGVVLPLGGRSVATGRLVETEGGEDQQHRREPSWQDHDSTAHRVKRLVASAARRWCCSVPRWANNRPVWTATGAAASVRMLSRRGRLIAAQVSFHRHAAPDETQFGIRSRLLQVTGGGSSRTSRHRANVE